jgi:RNA polymerase sigma-70 factor (ECF subfamily)
VVAGHLLSIAETRDKAAFRSLYLNASARIYRLALQILRSPADAEEIVSDTFVWIWFNAHLFKQERGSALSWLLVAARHRAIDRHRKHKRELEVLQGAWREDADYANDGAAVLARGQVQERQSVLVEMLAGTLVKISPIQRQIVEMAFYDGFTHSEISVGLAMPLGTVKSHIRRALLELKTHVSNKSDTQRAAIAPMVLNAPAAAELRPLLYASFPTNCLETNTGLIETEMS